MLRKLAIVAVATAFVGVVPFWLLTIPAGMPESALPPHTPNLANGETMFWIGGCAGCHAADKDNLTLLGGGRALKSPFGTFYAPNISSDRADGIGGWSEAAFIASMRNGVSPDGRHYYPAFPFTSYQRMAVADLRDLFAYLKTLPAVRGRAPEHELTPPFNIRRLIGIWKLLYLDGEPFAPDPTKSAQWNRGAYLVNGPGHCAECHSARNWLGAIIEHQRFAGGPDLEQKGWVPNITGKGLREWSEGDIAYLLESGMLPDGDAVGSIMTAVVRHTAKLNAQDRAAIAVYLKSLPPVDGPPRPTKK